MGTGMPGACAEIPVDISSRFNVLGYPNGGYLTRLAAETLARRSAHPDLLSINASFLGHPVSSPATARIVELRSMKSLSRATLSLMQESALKVLYVATFTDFSQTTGATATHCAGPQLPATLYRACVSIDTLAIPDPMHSFISQFDLRLAPGALRNSEPEHTAIIDGWIALDDEASPTLASLAFFADAFPPPSDNVIDRAEWGSVPTIDYAVYLKAAPGPGPIHARFVTKDVRNGLLVIDGELRDTSGQLVAESLQLAKFRGTLGDTRPASRMPALCVALAGRGARHAASCARGKKEKRQGHALSSCVTWPGRDCYRLLPPGALLSTREYADARNLASSPSVCRPIVYWSASPSAIATSSIATCSPSAALRPGFTARTSAAMACVKDAYHSSISRAHSGSIDANETKWAHRAVPLTSFAFSSAMPSNASSVSRGGAPLSSARFSALRYASISGSMTARSTASRVGK